MDYSREKMLGLLVRIGLITEEQLDMALAKQAEHGAVGCDACRNTGFVGRLGVFESMQMDDEMTRLFLKNAPAEELRALAITKGMVTLRRDALDKVAAGITSLSEVDRTVV